MKTRQILWVSEIAELVGGCEHYIRNTAALLRERGVSNILLYGGRSVRIAPEMLEAFDAAFPIAEPARQIAEIAPSVVYIHQLRGESVTRAFAQSGRPVMRFYHDHALFCLRQHKCRAITYRFCQKPIGLCCYPCLGFVTRYGGRLRFSRLGTLRAEQRANLAFDLHIVGSQYMARQLAMHQFPEDKIRVLPLYSLQPQYKDPIARDPELLLYIGNLTRGKGLDVLLDALCLVKRAVRLIVVGTGRQEKWLRDRCQSLGLNGRVSFVSRISPDEVAKYYRRATCVIIPSRQPETFSLVGTEAMSHGTAVIASGIGGIMEWLEDGKTGLAVPPSDSQALGNAISRVVSDPELARTLGENGRRRYEERFQPERHVDSLIAHCDSLVR